MKSEKSRNSVKTIRLEFSELRMPAVFNRKNRRLSSQYDRKFTPSDTTSWESKTCPGKCRSQLHRALWEIRARYSGKVTYQTLVSWLSFPRDFCFKIRKMPDDLNNASHLHQFIIPFAAVGFASSSATTILISWRTEPEPEGCCFHFESTGLSYSVESKLFRLHTWLRGDYMITSSNFVIFSLPKGNFPINLKSWYLITNRTRRWL